MSSSDKAGWSAAEGINLIELKLRSSHVVLFSLFRFNALFPLQSQSVRCHLNLGIRGWRPDPFRPFSAVGGLAWPSRLFYDERSFDCPARLFEGASG